MRCTVRRLLAVTLTALASACSTTAPPYVAKVEMVCDATQFEEIYKRPARGVLRAGFVDNLQYKLEKFLLSYEACHHTFTYEYFIDRNYSGGAPGLLIRVTVDYIKKDKPTGCIISSLSSHCFNSQGRLEFVQDTES